LALITPASLLTSTSAAIQQRTTMVGESWDLFKKRVFGEKHISGIMCENPGHVPSLPTPMHKSDKHIDRINCSSTVVKRHQTLEIYGKQYNTRHPTKNEKVMVAENILSQLSPSA